MKYPVKSDGFHSAAFSSLYTIDLGSVNNMQCNSITEFSN